MAKSLNRRMKIIGFKDPCNPPITPDYPAELLLWGKETDLAPPAWMPDSGMREWFRIVSYLRRKTIIQKGHTFTLAVLCTLAGRYSSEPDTFSDGLKAELNEYAKLFGLIVEIQ